MTDAETIAAALREVELCKRHPPPAFIPYSRYPSAPEERLGLFVTESLRYFAWKAAAGREAA